MAIYLVTGGAGFIGSHLVEELLRRGHRVRIADNLSTGKRTNVEAAVSSARGNGALAAHRTAGSVEMPDFIEGPDRRTDKADSEGCSRRYAVISSRSSSMCRK